MNKYTIYNPSFYYDGPWGTSTKDKVMDFSADRLEQAILDIESDSLRKGNITSSSYLTAIGLEDRINRDFAMDSLNPENKLPVDFEAVKMMNTIPMFGYTLNPLFDDQNIEAHNQVSLVQSAFLNAARQERLYTDPNIFGDAKYTQTSGTPFEMMPKTLDAYSFEGSAAGVDTNQLSGGKYDEAIKEQSIETMTAF